MMRTFLLLLYFFALGTQNAQSFDANNLTYFPLDSNKQKWSNWEEPMWLHYFGLEVDKNRNLQIVGVAWNNYKWMHAWRNETVQSPVAGSHFREYHWKRTPEERETFLRIGRKEEPQTIRFTEIEYEGSPHYMIKTNEITYYYDKEGGGFSRIIDTYGNDWVSFKREPWGEYPASAASAFRGLPNLVYQGEDDGAGHPGHKKCKSWIEGNKILTESLSAKWKWSWTFEEDYAKLEMIRTDPIRAYWFLYEGTPGGKFQPDHSYFGSDKEGPISRQYDFYSGNILQGQFQWIYAGHTQQDHVFYMIHLQKDEKEDMVSFLGNTEEGLSSKDGMTVWGFGRDTATNPLLSGPQQFIIGFYPNKITSPSQHKAFEQFISSKFLTKK